MSNGQYPIVEVEWEDSATYTGWHDREITEFEYVTAKSVGYLITKSKNILVVAQSLGSGEPFCNVTTIPRKCVLSMEIIR